MSEPGSLIRALSGRPLPRNYHSYVINEVGLAIVSGQLAVGTVLPNDAEMMARFDVSRTVLREALKTLEAKGLVEARAKVGTRVLPQSRWNLFDRQILSWVQLSGPDAALLAGFFDIRRVVEVEAAGLAAQHRTAEQMRLLHYWLNQRSAMTGMPEPFALAEFELHRVIGEASHNPFLRAASGLVEFGVVVSVARRLGPDLSVAPEGLSAQKAPLYVALLAAIESGNEPGAKDAMALIIAADRITALAV